MAKAELVTSRTRIMGLEARSLGALPFWKSCFLAGSIALAICVDGGEMG